MAEAMTDKPNVTCGAELEPRTGLLGENFVGGGQIVTTDCNLWPGGAPTDTPLGTSTLKYAVAEFEMLLIWLLAVYVYCIGLELSAGPNQ